jgi:hypothetical protein
MAIVAAYAFALQTLLLPFAVAASRGTPVPICSSAFMAGSGDTAPGDHNSGCPCAAGCGTLCCGHALAAPPQNFAAIIHVAGQTPVAFSHCITHVAVPLRLRVCAARGPPLA